MCSAVWDSQQTSRSAINVAISPTSSALTKNFGQNYTIMDTAGNKVTIADIASSEVLRETYGYVANHEDRVDKLERGFALKVDSFTSKGGMRY